MIKIIMAAYWLWEDTKNAAALLRIQVDGDDEAIETQDLGENEDEDHAHKQSRLLRSTTNSNITNYADGVPGREAWKADCKACSQMHEAPAKKITERGQKSEKQPSYQ